jgi:hypothetical protein
LQHFSRLGCHHRQQRCERGASGPPTAVEPSRVSRVTSAVWRSRVTSSSGAGLTRRRSRVRASAACSRAS